MADTIKVRCAKGHQWDILMSTRAPQTCGHDSRRCLTCHARSTSVTCSCGGETYCSQCAAGRADDRPQSQACPTCHGSIVHVVSAPQVTVQYWRR